MKIEQNSCFTVDVNRNNAKFVYMRKNIGTCLGIK